MINFKILIVGRPKEEWVESGIAEYCRRLQGTAKIDTLWLRDDEQLIRLLDKETNSWCLDPRGKTFTSESFAVAIQQKLEREGARMTFVIGGAEGLPEGIRKANPLISLSSLTFTHQFARLILVEQIYRALEILRGSPYHK